jgi:hypothetical protein
MTPEDWVFYARQTMHRALAIQKIAEAEPSPKWRNTWLDRAQEYRTRAWFYLSRARLRQEAIYERMALQNARDAA